MAKRGLKTNAARQLDRARVPYEVRTYECDPTDLSAAAVARALAWPLGRLYKTLVARGDRTGPLFAVLDGASELELKALARASGNRRVQLLPLAEVQPLTGYVRGGVTPLAAKKALPVVIDAGMRAHERISISAGQRGAQLILRPADLIAVTGATVALIRQTAKPDDATTATC